MPIMRYRCEACNGFTEDLYFKDIPETCECEHCHSVAHRIIAVTAKPAPIFHMGNHPMSRQLGQPIHDNRELDSVMDRRGLVHSTTVARQLKEYDPEEPVKRDKEWERFNELSLKLDEQYGGERGGEIAFSDQNLENFPTVRKELETLHQHVEENT